MQLRRHTINNTKYIISRLKFRLIFNMAPKSQITIIIPVYNRAEIVKATLDSVANQSLRPLDVILVDNNSTDNTLEVLNEWKNVVEANDFHVTILTESKPGATAARNKGLKEVKTPFTMFFDSDDIMLPSHAKRAIDALNSNTGIDIVGWDIYNMHLNNTIVKYPFHDKNIFYNHIFHATFSTQRYAARTELFKKIGGWNEALLGWNDYELGVRILSARPTIKKLKGEPTVKVISQQDSITGVKFSSKPQCWEMALDAIDKILDNSNNQKMKKYIDVRRVILAGFYQREGATNDAQRLLGKVESRSGWYRNLILRLFFNIIYRGGRGIAFLARPLLCFTK